jgi:RNA polymerase sigma factor (sigma-70 family)
MADSPPQTAQLHRWLERMRAGDLTAREELLRSVCGRLERLARKMLRQFPGVHRWTQTDDVLQNALLRLLRALEQVQPAGMRDFFNLAAQQIRRELLDLARHYYGPCGVGANHDSQPQHATDSAPEHHLLDQTDNPDELDRWCRFHEEVERLPADEREVVGLIFYHGWTQVEVAEVCGVDVRTVRRRWEFALVQLHRVLHEDEA